MILEDNITQESKNEETKITEEKKESTDITENPAIQTTTTTSAQTPQQTNEVKSREVLKKPKVPTYVTKDRPSLTEEQMYLVAKTFSAKVFSIPEVYQRLSASKIKIRMKYFDDERWINEPEITIDCSGDNLVLHTGPCDIKPDITMYMHAYVAHLFWMHKINLMAAVIKGEIRAIGPINKAMKLLPTLKPSFAIYKDILREIGLGYLIDEQKQN